VRLRTFCEQLAVVWNERPKMHSLKSANRERV
jgi:hypothetical protein